MVYYLKNLRFITVIFLFQQDFHNPIILCPLNFPKAFISLSHNTIFHNLLCKDFLFLYPNEYLKITFQQTYPTKTDPNYDQLLKYSNFHNCPKHTLCLKAQRSHLIKSKRHQAWNMKKYPFFIHKLYILRTYYYY